MLARIIQRFDGPTMATHSPIAAQAMSSRPQADLSPMGDQCHSFCDTYGMPMADAASRFPELEYGVRNLLALEKRRDLGEGA